MYTDIKIKIALIDDEPAFLDRLKNFILQRYPQAQVTLYSSGEEAIERMYEAPDLIFIDYQLDAVNPAAMNGIQVLQRLKQMFPESPVVFISAVENPEVAAHTIKFGAYDYLIKNEHTFPKAEILLQNILSHGTLRKNLGAQRFFNRLLVFLLFALLAGILIIALTK
jgi:DNA-binding NarL/FixJ family response regulator